MQTILEYIKKSKTVDYNEFPTDLNDEHAIIDWLDRNGFVEMSNDINIFSVGKKCYVVGRHKEEDTYWIRISDGRKYVVMIRTRDTETRVYKNTGKISLSYFIGKRPHLVKITENEMLEYINEFNK